MGKLLVWLLQIAALASPVPFGEALSLIFSRKRKCTVTMPKLRDVQLLSALPERNADVALRDEVAYPEQTPHSGRHFLPSHPAFKWPLVRRLFWNRRRRFTEGWYYRLTLVEQNVSFAFIVSIEDPGFSPPSDLRLACVQVIGPENGYLVQADRDDRKFWAWKNQQAFGCAFEVQNDFVEEDVRLCTAMDPQDWKSTIKSGFQVTPTRLFGRIDGHDGSRGGVLNGQGESGFCEFDISVVPICGWGGHGSGKQKSTAGWLAAFEVFEPHWQVTLADARASGFVFWNNTKYEFEDEPFYAEKNWGAALPSKWYWTQCNSFEGFDELSITAGGGVRKLPFGQQETLGMVGVHYNGTLYEAVPWNGSMEWKVSPWGNWTFRGNSTTGDHPFAVEATFECDPEVLPGLVFRAPTPDQGMVYFCRDTFEASVTLSLWELQWDVSRNDYVRKYPAVVDEARSNQGGAEVGGGPWWDTWTGGSELKKSTKALLRLPRMVQKIKKKLRLR
jgi:tocopherol cyclase